MYTYEKLSQWLEVLHLAWAEGKTERVPELFSGCETYWESPWEKIPREELVKLWEPLTGQKAHKLEFKVLSFDGTHAVVSWFYVTHKGEESAGVLWLKFENDTCKDLRMWWMPKELIVQ